MPSLGWEDVRLVKHEEQSATHSHLPRYLRCITRSIMRQLFGRRLRCIGV